jgi:hypothetical protein
MPNSNVNRLDIELQLITRGLYETMPTISIQHIEVVTSDWVDRCCTRGIDERRGKMRGNIGMGKTGRLRVSDKEKMR